MSEDADARSATNRLAAAAYARGEPTAWFEQLYVEADDGHAVVPWDRDFPAELLREWAQGSDGAGRTALVVGCGYGRDAEFIGSLGYRTTAFDLAPTVIAAAQRRHPGSPVRYEIADLLELPGRYHRAFDLVVENITVQALPQSLRAQAINAIASTVAPGGTLVVVEYAADQPVTDGPPFPLLRNEIESFATDGLRLDDVVDVTDDEGARRWRAVLSRRPRE